MIMYKPTALCRLVDLSHNEFSGTVSDQFDFFASNQDHGVTSRLLVDDNERDQLPTIKRQYEPDAFVADLWRWLVRWYDLPCYYGRGEHRIQ